MVLFNARIVSLLLVCSGAINAVDRNYCGDGIVDREWEECDRNIASCADFGNFQGIVSCKASCKYDFSNCIVRLSPHPVISPRPLPPSSTTGFCGDGIINGDEYCDGSTMSDKSCREFNGGSGVLKCKHDCKLDISGCIDAAVEYHCGR